MPCAKAATLGCFIETKAHLLLQHYAGAICPNDNVTVERCASACHSLRFPVAGIDSNHCFCGDAAALSPRNGRPMAECLVTNCSGDPREKCGGNGRLLAFNFTCSSRDATMPPEPAVQCGVDSYPFNHSIPNVLLIGDSVMFAHVGPVVKQIFDRCELAHDFCQNSTEILPRGRFANDGMLASVQSTGQAANTASGVACMGSYIQQKKWDVILINFGTSLPSSLSSRFNYRPVFLSGTSL